jgi:dienelactone hydrolase
MCCLTRPSSRSRLRLPLVLSLVIGTSTACAGHLSPVHGAFRAACRPVLEHGLFGKPSNGAPFTGLLAVWLEPRNLRWLKPNGEKPRKTGLWECDRHSPPAVNDRPRRFAESPVNGAWAQPPIYRDKTDLLVYRDTSGKDRRITTVADWAKRREHILQSMQLVMGRLPDYSSRIPLEVRIQQDVKTRSFLIRSLTFQAEKGERVPAFLLIPAGLKKPAPAVLCLHQTIAIGKSEPAGLGGSGNLAYAIHLAMRGYITLAPDYPSFGEYPYDFAKSPFKSGSMKAIWNNMRALDLLQGLPEVDGERIGCIGHSLGGHNTMFTAAFDPRIKALVSNCGFTSFSRYYGGNLNGWTSPRYMPLIASLYHSRPEEMPFDFGEVVASFAPRPILAIAPLHDDNFDNSGVRDVMAAAQPVYDLFHSGEKLKAYYPDCRHDFPEDSRKVAYDWLDRWLKNSEGK